MCFGFSAPVDSTVKILSSSLSDSVSVTIFAEFHFACSVPLPNLACASNFIDWPGASVTIGISSDVGTTLLSWDFKSTERIVHISLEIT